MTILNPCHKCGHPATVLDGQVEGTWEIGCWGEDCDSHPVTYQGGNNRSKAAAIRTWNERYERKRSENK